MITTKSINPGQLQVEALKIGTPHISLSLTGASDGQGIVPAGAELHCIDVANSSIMDEPCASCMTAYNAHVAKGNPAPVNANETLATWLSNWASVNPSSTAAKMAADLAVWLPANQPAVPAV